MGAGGIGRGGRTLVVTEKATFPASTISIAAGSPADDSGDGGPPSPVVDSGDGVPPPPIVDSGDGGPPPSVIDSVVVLMVLEQVEFCSWPTMSRLPRFCCPLVKLFTTGFK